jgi:hypothetical protein
MKEQGQMMRRREGRRTWRERIVKQERKRERRGSEEGAKREGRGREEGRQVPAFPSNPPNTNNSWSKTKAANP